MWGILFFPLIILSACKLDMLHLSSVNFKNKTASYFTQNGFIQELPEELQFGTCKLWQNQEKITF